MKQGMVTPMRKNEFCNYEHTSQEFKPSIFVCHQGWAMLWMSQYECRNRKRGKIVEMPVREI